MNIYRITFPAGFRLFGVRLVPTKEIRANTARDARRQVRAALDLDRVPSGTRVQLIGHTYPKG